jgi:predicted ester cyclase
MTRVEELSQKAMFTRIIAAANAHDDKAMSETFDEFFDPNVVIHRSLLGDTDGVEAIKEIFITLHRAFPDLYVRTDDLLEEGDKVVARQTVTGTNQGELMGRPATGRSVTYDEIFIFRFANQRVVEIWGVVDFLSLMRQLGIGQL